MCILESERNCSGARLRMQFPLASHTRCFINTFVRSVLEARHDAPRLPISMSRQIEYLNYDLRLVICASLCPVVSAINQSRRTSINPTKKELWCLLGAVARESFAMTIRVSFACRHARTGELSSCRIIFHLPDKRRSNISKQLASINRVCFRRCSGDELFAAVR